MTTSQMTSNFPDKGWPSSWSSTSKHGHVLTWYQYSWKNIADESFRLRWTTSDQLRRLLTTRSGTRGFMLTPANSDAAHCRCCWQWTSTTNSADFYIHIPVSPDVTICESRKKRQKIIVLCRENFWVINSVTIRSLNREQHEIQCLFSLLLEPWLLFILCWGNGFPTINLHCKMFRKIVVVPGVD